MNDTELKTEETATAFREGIVEMVMGIEDEGTLSYLHRFIELFVEKWGNAV